MSCRLSSLINIFISPLHNTDDFAKKNIILLLDHLLLNSHDRHLFLLINSLFFPGSISGAHKLCGAALVDMTSDIDKMIDQMLLRLRLHQYSREIVLIVNTVFLFVVHFITYNLPL